MVAEADLKLGQPRLLTVDNELVLPVKTVGTAIVTAVDVLHSFAVPALGIKIDAVPGRLSQVELFSYAKGTFYGQCSEICGVNHGFMPIAIKFVDEDEFTQWYTDRLRSAHEDEIEAIKEKHMAKVRRNLGLEEA